jgi:FKBP-type peptidyl-prolyl cis-trans isomerase (trigger factor)
MSSTNVKITRDEAAHEAEIKAEISADALARAYDAALKDMQKTVAVDGFRLGHAPLDRIVAIYGEAMILARAAERAIQDELPLILAKEQLMIIAPPRVEADTPAKGATLSFIAKAPLMPIITLPDYKKIAKKASEQKEDTSVTDEEHAEATVHIRRERARIDKIESGVTPKEAAEVAAAIEVNDLPELDDAFVQSLGIADAPAFAEALRANIKNEKELRASEKRRAAILEELVKQSTVRYPTMLQEYELDDMEARMKEDIARTGSTLEGYLNETKKTREELRAQWKSAADSRAKVRLILGEIARIENIGSDSIALDNEVQQALKHYKDADPAALRAHIAHAMRNDATLRFLENITDAPPIARD